MFWFLATAYLHKSFETAWYSPSHPRAEQQLRCPGPTLPPAGWGWELPLHRFPLPFLPASQPPNPSAALMLSRYFSSAFMARLIPTSQPLFWSTCTLTFFLASFLHPCGFPVLTHDRVPSSLCHRSFSVWVKHSIAMGKTSAVDRHNPFSHLAYILSGKNYINVI